jgi:hypothetical protein
MRPFGATWNGHQVQLGLPSCIFIKLDFFNDLLLGSSLLGVCFCTSSENIGVCEARHGSPELSRQKCIRITVVNFVDVELFCFYGLRSYQIQFENVIKRSP